MAIITDNRENKTPATIQIHFTDEVGIKVDNDLEWQVGKILENAGYDIIITKEKYINS